jgi:hypothetical protein
MHAEGIVYDAICAYRAQHSAPSSTQFTRKEKEEF